MKKSYVSPAVKEVEINSKEVVMSGSILIGEGEVDPGQSWSNRRRGTNENDWDNIWSN